MCGGKQGLNTALSTIRHSRQVSREVVMGKLRYRIYRPFSKFIHLFNLHYAPPVGFSETAEYRGIHVATHQQYWCKWCGLRGEVTKVRLREMK